jgi:hypothetical protein
MTRQSIQGIPEVIIDDGAAFAFGIGNVSLGFMHRPSDPVEIIGGTIIPPVKWTVYHNLESWVEAVKYAFRNNKQISIIYDDAIYIQHPAWSVTYSSGGAGSGSRNFQFVYEIDAFP